MVRAIWWKRLVGSLIDGIILGVIGLALSFVFAIVLGNLGIAIAGVIHACIVFAYYYLTEIKTGQSLGKTVLSTKVISDSGLAAASDVLLKRCLFKMIAVPLALVANFVAIASPAVGGLISFANLIPAVVLLVSGLMIFRASKLAWHDELFKTQVIDLSLAGHANPQGFEVMPPTTPPTT
jgi:uncharacterized RDD family membrane protein YckC